jgi:hypothetical protein
MIAFNVNLNMKKKNTFYYNNDTHMIRMPQAIASDNPDNQVSLKNPILSKFNDHHSSKKTIK